MVDILLKKAGAKDWKEVEFFEKNAACKYYFPINWEDNIKEFLKHSYVYFIVFQEKTVGLISYKFEDDGFVYINGFNVLPEHRRKGIATETLKKIMWIFECQKKFRMVVHPDNKPVIILYMKQNFVIKWWKNNYFGDWQPRLLIETVDNPL